MVEAVGSEGDQRRLRSRAAAVTILKSQPSPRLRVFCLPHAGAGASAFREWPSAFPGGIELCCLQPPGRERRIAEPPSISILEIAASLVSDIVDMLDTPFAFFGHSMGALVAFEATRELRRRGLGQPVHLVVSGVRAPQSSRRIPELHRAPDAELVAELRRLGGSPPEVLEHMELLDLLLPVLRADLTACETYTYLPEEPLSCPLSAWGGRSDADVNDEELLTWARETTGPFTVRRFEGGHLYPANSPGVISRTLARTLARYPQAVA